jgi:uncharacterized damage-inducible protein DinB
MRLIEPVLVELEQESATTRRILERVRDDKLSWKPHEKSMSLGELALHVATIAGEIASAASAEGYDLTLMRPPRVPATKTEILRTFDQQLRTAKVLLGRMDDAFLLDQWRLTKAGRHLLAMSRIALIRSILLNHSYHHRG